MASILGKKPETNYALFAIDGSGELYKLPTTSEFGREELASCPPVVQGSIARGSNGRSYVLTSSGEWVEYINAHGGGGSINIADFTDIDSIFV